VSQPLDESLLDDDQALADADPYLRYLAEAGSRVRRDAAAVAEASATAREPVSPRAVVAAGTDARLLRAVLEPHCPVPFVAWPGPGLPGWAGTMDMVLVLAGTGGDSAARTAVAEGLRRGCTVVLAAPAHSVLFASAEGHRDAVTIPTDSGDALGVAVGILELLHRWDLGPAVTADTVAGVLDSEADAAAPRRPIGHNPAKENALALADHVPLVWGGSVLAARAGRRVAELLRRASGLPVLAADAAQLLTVLVGTPENDVFADPFDQPTVRPVLLLLDDGNTDPGIRERAGRLRSAASVNGVRVITLKVADGAGPVDAYAALLQQGAYAAAYLAIGTRRLAELANVRD
jgi:hypothetical protein